LKRINKILTAATLLALNTGNLLAATTPGKATESLQGEILGIGQTIGTGLIVFIMIFSIAAPIGGFFFAKNMSKKKAEQNQEESGGIMAFVWGAGGALAGFFATFFVIGYLGSMADEGATAGEVDLVKGNQFVIKNVLGNLITNTGKSLGGAATP